jgi:penicillin-binding protein 2
MPKYLGKFFRKKKKYEAINPDEIFLDSTNLPEFDRSQFEGRIEKPIGRKTIYFMSFLFVTVACLFLYRLDVLQVYKGDYYRGLAETNRLHNSLIFGERGVITDRNGELLAWNKIDPESTDFVKREYRDTPGTHQLVGYVKYPKKDKYGFYYNTDYSGAEGVEKYYDSILQGENGLKITETDAMGKTISDSVVRPEKNGETIKLSIDVKLQEAFYKNISEIAKKAGYVGGAGAMMDLSTGQVLTAVSYPEFDSNIMTDGTNVSVINNYQNSLSTPFLDRLNSGLYAPGSIVKPFFAIAALAEQVISPDKKIFSSGKLQVPNPYKPGEFTIFNDWRANGWTNMQEAIAVSSDVYFYEIGGGFRDDSGNYQRGIGIDNIDKYARMFGFGQSIPDSFFSGEDGVIPTPQWKAKNFNNEIWRIGDTYNTAIGQYGFQVTPIQALRAVSAIATGGELITPSILNSIDSESPIVSTSTTGSTTNNVGNLSSGNGASNGGDNQSGGQTFKKQFTQLPIDPKYFDIVRGGMRMTVTMGTAKILNVPYVSIAAKTGTAQVGVGNKYINSLVTGFFPANNPRYSFVLLLERAPSTNTIGASVAMRQILDWMAVNTPEYFGSSTPITDVHTVASSSPVISSSTIPVVDIGR